MKEKHIVVDEKTHEQFKKKAEEKGMTMRGLVKHLLATLK
jgi:hypothetical protein